MPKVLSLDALRASYDKQPRGSMSAAKLKAAEAKRALASRTTPPAPHSPAHPDLHIRPVLVTPTNGMTKPTKSLGRRRLTRETSRLSATSILHDDEAEHILAVTDGEAMPTTEDDFAVTAQDRAKVARLHKKMIRMQAKKEHISGAAQRHASTAAMIVQSTNPTVSLGLQMPASMVTILTALFNTLDADRNQHLGEEELARVQMLGGDDVIEVIEVGKDAKGRLYLSSWLKQWDKRYDWDALGSGQLAGIRAGCTQLKRDCSPKSIADVRAVLLLLFTALDRGGDGTLSKSEFNLARRCFPAQGSMRFPSNGDIAVHFDKDGDEEVDRREWISGFATLGKWHLLGNGEIDQLYCKLKATLEKVNIGVEEENELERIRKELAGEDGSEVGACNDGCTLS